MARKSKFKLPPLNEGKETTGQRLARLRKEKGHTQVELAEKIGIIQALISDYELDKLRLYDEMLSRFAIALDVSTDEILGLKDRKLKENPPNLRIMKRLKKIEELPPSKQKSILQTIDGFLKGEGIIS
jgi:transcriptional regulator with XRE-family HTH domain